MPRSQTANRRPARPRLEALEGREVPATLIGLTSADTLITFDSATPGTVTTTVPVLGLLPTEDLVGIDFRPATGQLYGVVQGAPLLGANDARLVIIDPTSGGTTTVGGGLGGSYTFDLDGTAFGVDFNPVPDRLRILTDNGQSLRVNPADGTAATADTAPFFEPTNDAANGFVNPAFFDPNTDGDFDPATNPPTLPADLDATGAGYTRQPGATPGTFTTTLYAIDSLNDVLVRIGGPDGDVPGGSPNAGQSFVVDTFRDETTFAEVDFGPVNGFDVEPATDEAFAVGADGTTLYDVNLTTAGVTSLGTISAGVGLTLRGLAVAGPVAGAGTVQLEATTFRFPDDRSMPLAVTITRTGGSTGAVTIDYATADGTAVGGRDYLPASGTITFPEGVTTQQIFLLRPANPITAAAPERSFTLTLSNPTGGATAGPNQTATVTVPAVAANSGGRRFAASQAAGTSQVAVYDQVGGTLAFTITPFGNFTGGVRVAAGDVNGDGTDDLIVGAGPGGGPRVSVYDGATLSASNQTLIANFFVYESTFDGGVYVAAGDVTGDGFDDVIVGAGFGGGPRVSVLNGRTLTSTTQTVVANFFAFEDTFRGGVFVAAGAFDGDGFADIVAGASIGGGPRVQVFGGASVLFAGTPIGPVGGTAMAAGESRVVLANYFAYESTFRNGVFVAAGDVNGDGVLDVVTGPGFGGGPNVSAFSGTTATKVAGFFAFDGGLRNGAPVGTADVDADGDDEILVGAGIASASGADDGSTGGVIAAGGVTRTTAANGGGTVRVFDAAGAQVADPLRPFGATYVGGVFVG